MSLVVREEHRDTAFYLASVLEDQSVGGNYGKHVISKVSLPTYPLVKAYMMVFATLKEPFNPMYRWKIAVDDVALTREFRPTVERSLDDGIHAAFVYDITSAIKNSEPTVRIVYDGKEPIRIECALMLTIHRYNDFSSYLELYTDPKPVHGRLSISLGAPQTFEPNERELFLGFACSRPADLTIYGVEGEKIVRRLANGFNLVELKPSSSNIEIEPSASVNQLFNIYTALYTQYPDLDVVAIAKEGTNVRATIVNKGNVAPDDVMVLLLRFGTRVASMKLDSIAPGESKEISLSIGSSSRAPAAGPCILRIVWRKGVRNFYKDYRI